MCSMGTVNSFRPPCNAFLCTLIRLPFSFISWWSRFQKVHKVVCFFIQARLLSMIAIPRCIQEDIFAIPNSHLGSPRGPAPAQQGLRTCVTTLWRRVSVAWSRSTSRAWEGQSSEGKMSPDFQMCSVRLLPCPQGKNELVKVLHKPACPYLVKVQFLIGF